MSGVASHDEEGQEAVIPPALKKVCVVCNKPRSQYCCRHCEARYCSAACYRQHEASGACLGPRREEFGRKRTRDDDEGEGSDVREDAVGSTSHRSRRRSQQHQQQQQGDSKLDVPPPNDGDLSILGEEHLAALNHDPKVRQQLRSRELQQLLVKIDSSKSRLDALEAAMYNVPEFATFCDHVLEKVYVVEGRKNGVDPSR